LVIRPELPFCNPPHEVRLGFSHGASSPASKIP
jgi:hypothetical protein